MGCGFHRTCGQIKNPRTQAGGQGEYRKELTLPLQSLSQTRQTRSPFMPSTITTFVTIDIFNLFVTALIVSRAARSSMQGTKNE